MKQKQPLKIYLLGSIVCVLLVGAVFLFLKEEKKDGLQMLTELPNEESETLTPEAVEEETIVIKVDVKGEVVRPGLYVAIDGDRVQDLIEQAGSFTKKADRNGVNLAQRVEDQMIIYVPAIGEELAAVSVPIVQGAGGGSTNQQSGKININQASAAELETITGIGPSKASAILQYREENGNFKSIDELKNISGIGDKTFEKLKDEVTI